MSQTLYEEAIAEARRLTEMAEQNAKNKIIDAVTPQIKRLIEQELMGAETEDMEDMSGSEDVEGEDMEGEEESGEESDVIDLDALSTSPDEQNPETSDAMSQSPMMPVSPAPSSPMKSSKMGSSGASLKMDGGEIEITVGGTKIEIEPADETEDGGDDDLLLDRPVAEALARMVAQRRGNQLRSKLQSLSERTATLRRALSEAKRVGTPAQKRRLANIFESLAREAVTLRKQVILTEKRTGGRTPETQLVESIIKEMKHMSRRNGKNVFDFLFEAEEEEMKDAGGAEGGDEAGDEKKVDIDVDALRDLVGQIEDMLPPEEGEEEEGEEGEEEEPMDLGGDEGEEGEEGDDVLALEVDTTEGYGAHEAYPSEMGMPGKEALPEARLRAAIRRRVFEAMKGKKGKDSDKKDAEKDDKKLQDNDKKKPASNEGRVFELDESALRRALIQMRSARRGRRLGEAAVDAAASFGGGEAGDEMFIDVDEETLLNVLADELGTAPKPKVGGAGLATEAARLRRQVADYRNVAGQLKSQLVEMNLFNAKLLYANKLMQNRDLSAKQQRAIVEALDNAKTLREAKLLYKSLTESLNKSTNKGGLTEGRTRILGSSSQSARSAQPINEAGGTDRWAVLAGIKKD